MKTLLLILCIVFMVTGCATTYVYIPKPYAVTLPDSFLKPCERAKPPEEKDYVVSSFEDKEGLLMDTLSTQYKYLDECDLRLLNAADWNKKQISLISELAAKAEKDARGK